MMNENSENQITGITKDIQYIKESLDRNFDDHVEIKVMVEKSMDNKISKSRFRPVEIVTYGLAGGTLFWALNQVLDTAKSFL